MQGLDLLVGSRAHLPLHLSAHLKERVRSSCGGARPSCKQQTYRTPTLCKGLGGSWQRPDSEAESAAFPAEVRSDSLCSLVPPGGSCWLWIKSMRGTSGLGGSLRLQDSPQSVGRCLLSPI